MLATCGPKLKDLSSITPRRRGVGFYLIGLSSLMEGDHFADVSLVEFEKKLDSLLPELRAIFHSLDHLATTSTDLWHISSASFRMFAVASSVTSSVKRELVVSCGRIFARLLV